MKLETAIALALSALLGVVYYFVVVALWGYYAASPFSPLAWLIQIFDGESVLFWAFLYTLDLLVNLLFAAPFAAILAGVRAFNNWACVWVAVLGSLIADYWGASWGYLNFALLAEQPRWWAALAMNLFTLPLAFVAVRAIRNRWKGVPPSSEAHGRAAA